MSATSLHLFAATLAIPLVLNAADVADTIVNQADGTKIVTKTQPAKIEVLRERVKDAGFEASARVAWAKLSAEKKETVNKLLQRIKAALPKGWNAAYVAPFALFCIWREERTLADPFGAGLPLTLDEVRESIQVTYFLRVQELVSPAQFAALAKKKGELATDINAQRQRLRGMHMSHRYDEFSPETREQKEAVSKFEALKKQDFELPEFSFEDISLRWDDIYRIKNLHPEQLLLDPSHRAECEGVREKIAQLMHPYALAAK